MGRPFSQNKELIVKKIIFWLILLTLSACCGLQKTPEKNTAIADTTKLQTCPDARPQICTQQYSPVCAQRDTGIRCVTTPCPSTENKTYSNGCTACADTKVQGYLPGACTDESKQE